MAMEMGATAEPSERSAGSSALVTLAFSATAGVMVEFYDFQIYGFAAASAFPAIFFPKLPPVQALVLSYLAFGAGFPARLVGAFIFGHFGDRAGRKVAFLTNLLIVGLTTFLTGLLPGYAKWGIAAPLLLIFLRIVQGVGIGGEFGGASALLAEFAARRQSRAFWMSLANLGVPLGAIASNILLLVLNKTFATTGWRVAMLLSAVILVPALVARYKLADSPLFDQLKQREQLARAPSLTVFRNHARAIVLVAIVLAFTQMEGYVGIVYSISFMTLAGIPLATTATILLITRTVGIPGLILSGPLANLLKRKPVAFAAIAMTTILSYPLALAVLNKRVLLVVVLDCLMKFGGLGLMQGLAPILTSESFPTKFRYSGAGISFNLSAVLGGMIAPLVLASLIGTDVRHYWYFIPIVYGIYCAAAMLALLFLRETRDVAMEDLDREELSVELKIEGAPS
jgi:MFS transporter, MHS family, shikimate and dehydroshikimate transport protein